MKKRFVALLLCVLLLCGSLFCAAESAPVLPDAPETTDTILYAKSIDRKTLLPA